MLGPLLVAVKEQAMRLPLLALLAFLSGAAVISAPAPMRRSLELPLGPCQLVWQVNQFAS
jgi:hypothetical protein